MMTRCRCDRSHQRLSRLRLDIAKAEARLSSLLEAIKDAQSDAGLAAVQSVRAENRHLVATNLLAEQAACANQAALDLAVKASQTDPLTGLRNRSVLWDRLSHELDLAGRLGLQVGVFVLDLDDFKQLNDQHGHAVGDLLLQHVANTLMATVRASDTICRLGGDEFVVIASTATREDVDRFAEKISEALCLPLSIAGTTIMVSASLGVAIYPEDGDLGETLVALADRAMYDMKRSRAGQRRR